GRTVVEQKDPMEPVFSRRSEKVWSVVGQKDPYGKTVSVVSEQEGSAPGSATAVSSFAGGSRSSPRAKMQRRDEEWRQ
ncbi:hypothetical protein Dimus_015700, partial [Dionaea muscipula]